MIAAIEEILQQEALKGNQGDIDKNHNNKVDAEDFEILRGEKKAAKKAVKEEESVEEGVKELAKKAFKALTGGSDEDQLKDLQRKMNLPQTGKKPEPQKEEVEQIDELSKSTLGSYVKGAARDAGASHKLGADFKNQADKSRSPSSKAASSRLSDKFYSMAQKRHKGIGKAVERLTKEEVEQIEEKNWIAGAIKHPGAETAAAKKAGMSVQAYAQKHKHDTGTEGKRARLAITLKQFKENAFDWKKKPEPQPNGGSGVKQGSRYGGSKQKDTPEQDTDEKK